MKTTLFAATLGATLAVTLLTSAPLAHAELNAELNTDLQNQLLKTGLLIQVADPADPSNSAGTTYTFPLQSKDLTNAGLTPAFLNYVTTTLHGLLDKTAQDLHVLAVDLPTDPATDPTAPSKVTQEGRVEDGQKIIDFLTRLQITAALTAQRTAQTTTTPYLQTIPGKVLNDSGTDLGPLDLIGEGKSTFWGSSPERGFNIRKALNEKFNGVLIPAGATFSYVDLLGPIEYGGWKRALVIVNGQAIEPAPAGGVCQVSTTVYRAALDAALQITEQRNHSLYVIYYNDYGDGLDATVFPGEQDLKFVNNTHGPILMVAQEEAGTAAVIRLYGTSDGRKTTLIGPYTASNETDETAANVGDLGIGDIAWKYLITWGDGTEETRWLHSTYFSKAKQHKEPASELQL